MTIDSKDDSKNDSINTNDEEPPSDMEIWMDAISDDFRDWLKKNDSKGTMTKLFCMLEKTSPKDVFNEFEAPVNLTIKMIHLKWEFKGDDIRAFYAKYNPYSQQIGML